MKICVAQTRPVKGDIQSNTANHTEIIHRAVADGADVVIFPELSLTGYEPSLAAALAVHQDDGRFDDFQTISDSRSITIGVGVPTKSLNGICISLLLFRPYQPRQTYAKQYLHPDEAPFFVGGPGFPVLSKTNVALAICYELSVPAHAQMAHEYGAEIYIASVAKSAPGVKKAGKRLAGIAREYSMTVLMANCVGPADDFVSGGGTAVWNQAGLLLGQLDGTHEGILIYDTGMRFLQSSFFARG